MPNDWGKTATFEQRFAYLDKIERRCDGNSRHCTRPAVDKLEMKPADGQFHVIADAPMETKLTCAPHRPQFLLNGRWVVFSNRPLPRATPRGRAA